MFKIGDYVIYGLTGVCTVVDIKPSEITKEDCYILTCNDSKHMTICIPVTSDKVRAPISSSEALSHIKSLPSLNGVWYDRMALESEVCKTLKGHDVSMHFALLKGFHEKRIERNNMGKDLTTRENRIFNQVKHFIFTELSVALNISVEEIEDFIQKNIKEV